MKLRGLIISPVLPEQTGQGNRARVYDLAKTLTKYAELDLVYYLYEIVGNTEKTLNKANDFNDLFKLTFPVAPTISIQPPPENGKYHGIDEWWDESLEGTIKYLANNIQYDFVLVNYVWLSKALDFFPKSVVKIIDAHDIFTNREKIYDVLKVSREFFYTNKHEEKLGLERADVVIALQKNDADFFDALTSKYDVVCMPHLPTVNGMQSNANEKNIQKNKEKLRIGLLGVSNLVNINSFNAFISKLSKTENFSAYEIIIAGSICKEINFEYENIQLLGYVPELRDFYSKIDIFINPVEHSTGQKIKLADTISYQIPFLSTQNGSEGLPVSMEQHKYSSINELVFGLSSLFTNDDLVLELKKSTIKLQSDISKLRGSSIEEILGLIRFYRRSIVVYVGNSNNYYENSLNFERALNFVAQISGMGNVKIVVNNNLNQTAVSEENFLESNEGRLIDVLIYFGQANHKLEILSKKIISDGLSNIDNFGARNISDGMLTLLPRSINSYHSNIIHLTPDVGYIYKRHLKHKESATYVLVSNYSSSNPKIFKRILEKNLRVRLLYPHQIKTFKTLDEYSNFFQFVNGLIVLDSTDFRYSILCEMGKGYGIPVIQFDRVLSQHNFGIKIVTLVKFFNRIVNLIKSRSSTSGINGSTKNIWDVNPNIWNELRG